MNRQLSVISFFHVRFTLFVRQYRLWRKCPVWFLPPVRCPAVYACGMPQGAVLSASRSVPHVPHRRRSAVRTSGCCEVPPASFRLNPFLLTGCFTADRHTHRQSHVLEADARGLRRASRQASVLLVIIYRRIVICRFFPELQRNIHIFHQFQFFRQRTPFRKQLVQFLGGNCFRVLFFLRCKSICFTYRFFVFNFFGCLWRGVAKGKCAFAINSRSRPPPSG